MERINPKCPRCGAHYGHLMVDTDVSIPDMNIWLTCNCTRCDEEFQEGYKLVDVEPLEGD